ncbi:MAG: hypothetical protein AB1796_00595 [Bacillota bacterium]
MDLVTLYREKVEKEVKDILDRTKSCFAGEGIAVETIFKRFQNILAFLKII